MHNVIGDCAGTGWAENEQIWACAHSPLASIFYPNPIRIVSFAIPPFRRYHVSGVAWIRFKNLGSCMLVSSSIRFDSILGEIITETRLNDVVQCALRPSQPYTIKVAMPQVNTLQFWTEFDLVDSVCIDTIWVADHVRPFELISLFVRYEPSRVSFAIHRPQTQLWSTSV